MPAVVIRIADRQDQITATTSAAVHKAPAKIPRTAPAVTSRGKCTPSKTRIYPKAQANAKGSNPQKDRNITAASVAMRNALNAWRDGKDLPLFRSFAEIKGLMSKTS